MGARHSGFLLLAFFFVFQISRIYALEPEELVRQIEEKAGQISDYQCRMREWARKGLRREKRIINFYFKSPRHMRMDILKGNRLGDNGAVSVFLPDETVWGKMGGSIMSFPLVVPSNHWAVTTIRGKSFPDGDLFGILSSIRRYLAASKAEVSESLIHYVLTVEPFNPTEHGGVTREIIMFDKTSMLPVATKTYKKNTLVEHISWREYIINAGIPDEFFDVSKHADFLDQMNIPSIALLPISEEDELVSGYRENRR